MSYTKLFDPPQTLILDNTDSVVGDRRDGSVYVYTERIVLAVNVALTTGRPLLIRGPSGSGKSSLARNVARHEGWRYYEEVITSRTEARDLLWTVDTLQRLHDAQRKEFNKPLASYIQPGKLWWAFDPDTARRRGAEPDTPRVPALKDPGECGPQGKAVVLLDEIDKADPDTPNNLLVPLGSLKFEIAELPLTVEAKVPPFVVITTNDERTLPLAFLRRCVVLELEAPKRSRLMSIAAAHFGDRDADLISAVAELVAPDDADDVAGSVSAAEYLDAVRACRELKVRRAAQNIVWNDLAALTLEKPQEPTR